MPQTMLSCLNKQIKVGKVGKVSEIRKFKLSKIECFFNVIKLSIIKNLKSIFNNALSQFYIRKIYYLIEIFCLSRFWLNLTFTIVIFSKKLVVAQCSLKALQLRPNVFSLVVNQIISCKITNLWCVSGTTGSRPFLEIILW